MVATNGLGTLGVFMSMLNIKKPNERKVTSTNTNTDETGTLIKNDKNSQVYNPKDYGWDKNTIEGLLFTLGEKEDILQNKEDNLNELNKNRDVTHNEYVDDNGNTIKDTDITYKNGHTKERWKTAKENIGYDELATDISNLKDYIEYRKKQEKSNGGKSRRKKKRTKKSKKSKRKRSRKTRK